jgi:hypothetical protein
VEDRRSLGLREAFAGATGRENGMPQEQRESGHLSFRPALLKYQAKEWKE